MKIVIAILIFSIIVIFHELGHFLLAKKNGVKVVEFSLGMGPRILSTVRGETRYSLKLLPLGGSCMMLGEDGEEEEPGSFNGASVWSRISIVAAGPIFNFILAFFLALIIVASIGYVPAEVLSVTEGSPAEEAGMQEGDLITEFDGYKIDIGTDLNTYLAMNELREGQQVELTYERDGKEYNVSYMPEIYSRYLLGFTRADTTSMKVGAVTAGMSMEEEGMKAGDVITAINGVPVKDYAEYEEYLENHPLGEESVVLTYERQGRSYEATITPALYEEPMLGFGYNVGCVKTSGWNIIKYSAIEVKYWIRTTVMSLGKLITGQFGIQDLSGPVGVVDAIGDTYEQSKTAGTLMVWMNMLNMAILLSANLGVMNLLPLPALDGGRLVFMILEVIFRRPVNRKVEGMVHFAGFMLLMLLMVVVMYNDIQRIF